MTIVRFTRQRQAVLEAVQYSTEHPDAAHIFESVRHVLPRISLGTVYRSLEALVEKGHLLQIQQPGMPTRYDARLEDHAHFVCDTCGQVFDLLATLPDPRPIAAKTLVGFEVLSAKIEFHGKCNQCCQN